jgi:hypothetical protein
MKFGRVDIGRELALIRRRERSRQDEVVQEARRILEGDLFSEKKILENLGRYEKRAEKLDEEDIDQEKIFSLQEIRRVATRQRLKLLGSAMYKPEIPFEALARIRELNARHRKDLKHFFVLSYPSAFEDAGCRESALLFSQTNDDGYYLVARWGRPVPWYRSLLYWPLRNFETLLATVVSFTLLVTLILPTQLITLDSKATYWSGYRAAAFMHLLIFNAGVTAYITLTFTRNFSSSVWNRKRDFD